MNNSFYERFDITTDIQEARIRFVNRVYNNIFTRICLKHSRGDIFSVIQCIASELGEEHIGRFGTFLGEIKLYTKDDFERVLQALEATYGFFDNENRAVAHLISDEIKRILQQSEVDLEIDWKDGKFFRKGARLLDEKLVNDNLHWLRDTRLSNVLEPYEKAIDHLTKAENNPKLLSDVITDAYEALEAMAKIVTSRDIRFIS